MIAYCLMAMKRGQAIPTLIAARTLQWQEVLPFRRTVFKDGNTFYESGFIGPIIRPADWLFWIERYDQPAWKAVDVR